MLRDRPQRLVLLFCILNLLCGTERDDGTVIHRMMKSGARQHQSIYNGDGHTSLYSSLKLSQHPARCGAMKIEFVFFPAEQRRDYKRLSIDAESDVRQKSGIEYLANQFGFM